MASLSKMAIRGIRSFDDKHIGVIEFFTPVTVIVGANGSGKTTIIECLKYATTGDQPPNTRGGAFIHDPKMANEKEVKAQVKLRFFAATGARMLAIRNLSVTVKKTGALTMKTLESILAADDGNAEKSGKRAVISTKCAELDIEIPILLGVSKAVLENVIFCHQEDSYWPLSEPSTLKKKFDDIFEATKYTKALDAIKALRKERVAELKTEKERLESLAREKTHADRLKDRITKLESEIDGKQIEANDMQQEYDKLVLTNKKFHDQAHSFKELYMKIQNLLERKKRYQEDLAEARENIQEIEGTDPELEERLANFGTHIQRQKNKRRQEENKRQDVEEEVTMIRRKHVALVSELGELRSQEKQQEDRLNERGQMIRDIAGKYSIKGYDYSPLEREKVVEFLSRLGDVQRKQNNETENLQNEARSKNEEYNQQSRQMHGALEGLKSQKTSLRSQITSLQSSISEAERTVDASTNVSADLKTLQNDIEEKRARVVKAQADLAGAGYEKKLGEKAAKTREMEDARERLNAELTALSRQADTRARFDIKRTELKSKQKEVSHFLSTNNAKFRKLVGTDVKAETMEKQLDGVMLEKEREHSELESAAQAMNRSLQQAENLISSLKAQLKAKQDEVKLLDKRIKEALEESDADTISQAMKEATDEIAHRKDNVGNSEGLRHAYEGLLKSGLTKKACAACDRHLNDRELAVFEKLLRDKIRMAAPDIVATQQAEMEEWQSELDRLQGLQHLEVSRDRLKNHDILAFEKQIKEQETSIPALSNDAENALERLNAVKQELKDLGALKQQSSIISRTQKDCERLTTEIADIEKELSATGSMKTADDVQAELDELAATLRTNSREQQALVQERDRQMVLERSHEKDLHEMEKREGQLRHQLVQVESLEQRLVGMKKEVADSTARLKALDSQIADAQAPIEQLDREYKELQNELEAKTAQAQAKSQELNINVDKLSRIGRDIERYVREKRDRRLREAEEQITQFEAEISQLTKQAEDVRDAIAEIDKEINESGASVASLRENIRVRKLEADIKATQKEVESYDIEAAAKAQKQFEDKYGAEKQRETNLHSDLGRVQGEIASKQSQLKVEEKDLREFRDIHKKYKDQLIKVKMSDMANSDLETYGKALDNAIMKYHSLKMEEVNDNMRHLWNKTYQGTDIDGIKIRYDAEGGASKRSYNYRVVMTKDQVEMDMRGRCSAGQKMLASIIIRLALSDSFGQNCGILALDEPTNALDLENIDALAASLVDIINERKNQSNFQLIIITHDENFLRKLGQSEVMEYYWRVSRDSRQKSVIERQRFR